ncbi:hypothetical protein BS329_29095 [Amycolatopsis coloradensis]|uniref:Uncharacterized protein n=1 Tax=Amycolatopsis coloradensis TaxID=76021 RepID=A0A1R0KKG7_9PSEU|nr:hypothetical protein [Amycolatopsis coloradensis]OLZ46868.1 hypothetical protein BS329_29095 [Amycolatopsis coloradensis]
MCSRELIGCDRIKKGKDGLVDPLEYQLARGLLLQFAREQDQRPCADENTVTRSTGPVGNSGSDLQRRIPSQLSASRNLLSRSQ